MHDVLTDLPNRAQAVLSIEHSLARTRRTAQPVALMSLDLDFLKAVNDGYGHATGDVVLRVCAQRRRGAVRASDMVFRFGGDEFVVLLEDVAPDFPLVGFAPGLIELISRPITTGEVTPQVGASVGVDLWRAARRLRPRSIAPCWSTDWCCTTSRWSR